MTTKYRDLLRKSVNEESASVVGCGLDILKRDVSELEIKMALEFYEKYKETLNKFPINGRRQAICDYINSKGLIIPEYL